jgi:hypothetical protein
VAEYGLVVAEWFLPSRRDLPRRGGGTTVARTELVDSVGAQIIVETRRIETSTWETTLTPGDASDPDGPDAVIFATVDSPRESLAVHEQAVEFAADALNSTLRRAPS